MCVNELNKIDASKLLDKEGKPDENAKKEILGKLDTLDKVLQEKKSSLGTKRGFLGLFGGKKSKKSKKSKSKTKKQRR
jgi:hypothetical protein